MKLNFLPPKNRELILKEKKLRKKILQLLIFFLASLVGILGSMIVKIEAQNMLSLKQILLTGFSQESFQQEYSDFQEFSSLLDKLTKFYQERTPIFYILKEIISSVPANVSLKSLNLENKILKRRATTIENKQVKIAGFSKDREDLLNFRKALSEKSIFEKIEIPVSSLVLPENLNFIINIKFK